MGQIIGSAAKPKRCNIQSLSSLGTPAAGEHILVSSDNSMNAAGQGHFDAYIVGDGTTVASSLPIHYLMDEQPTKNGKNGVQSGWLYEMLKKVSSTDINDPDNAIIIQDDNGNIVVRIDENGVEFSAATVGGENVLTMSSLSGQFATKAELNAKQDKIEEVMTSGTPSADDAIIVQDGNGNEVARFDENGLNVSGLRVGGLPFKGGHLRGKKIALFGDSIMQLRDNANKGVPEYLAEITDATIYRCAVGGLMLSRRESSMTPVASATTQNQLINYLDFGHSMPLIAAPLASRDLTDINTAYNRLKTEFSALTLPDVATAIDNWNNLDFNEIDIVIMSAGTNDTRYITLGNEDAANETTINGSVNGMVNALLTNYPHLSIYMFTPTVHYIEGTWSDDYTADGTGMNQMKPRAFYAGIKAAAERNHIPCKNMYDEMGWTRYNFSHYCHTGDGTHPYEGFENLAMAMASFIIANETFKQ